MSTQVQPTLHPSLGTVGGLILSRKGSQRLANKAWQPLGQTPLLAYTLLAASQAHGLTQTMLYTDDEAWQPWVQAFGLSWPSAKCEPCQSIVCGDATTLGAPTTGYRPSPTPVAHVATAYLAFAVRPPY
jgi:hypothetical protein